MNEMVKMLEITKVTKLAMMTEVVKFTRRSSSDE
jgi:hypothetical protein